MPRIKLSAQEDAIVRDLYPDTPTKQIAELLGRSINDIYTAADRIGVKKSAAYMAGPFGCRLRRGDEVGAQFRFKKGQVSWNKGKSYQPGGRCAETQFKPGQLSGRAALNIKPVGAERINADGYLERKINHDRPFHKRWRAVHIIVWEQANGPLPKGHALVFINGDKTDIRLDNLQLTTRADLMKRNSFHQYGKEIAAVVQLRSAINRRINNMGEKHE